MSTALASDHISDSGGSEEEFSGDEDDDMSDDDKVDDLITLDQVQAEARRDSLIRKGTHIGASTQKKGSIDQGGSCP